MNLGRDERCTPRFELTESARLAPVLGAAISSWRVEVVKPMKLIVAVLDSDDYVGRARKPHLTHIPSGSSQTYNWSCTWNNNPYIYALSRYKIKSS